MSAEIRHITEGAAGAEWHAQVDAHLQSFRDVPVGTRIVYYTGYLPPAVLAPIAAAARRADAEGLGLLFQRQTGNVYEAYGVREFDYLLVRCSPMAAKAFGAK